MKEKQVSWNLDSCPINKNLSEEERIQCDECNNLTCRLEEKNDSYT